VSLAETIDAVAKGIELLGIAALVAGLGLALLRGAQVVRGGGGSGDAYRVVRTVFGRSVLLGLEFLVAADIIRTVGVEPSLQNVAVLGLIVLIRTFLSLSIDVEIEGTWPWRRAASAGITSRRPPADTP
jgi:uncharacterized membrane protein